MRTGLKDKIARGEPSIGASLPMASLDLVDFCGFLGFEWVVVDTEAASIGPSECLAICRVCDSHGMAPVIKVPGREPEVIQAYLRVGATGVSVPHISTAEQARAVVDAARYPPEGKRGHDMGGRSGGYSPVAIDADYLARANRELLVSVLLENETGVRNLDEILEVPGIDALYIGPGDLALSMGYQDREHPVVQEMIAEGRRKILASGKALFGGAADLATAKQLIDEGSLLIHTRVTEMWGNDTRHYLQQLREHTRR